jgi:predicted glycoside hydrolase/deacetylase ChbG (UPF0249 family)
MINSRCFYQILSVFAVILFFSFDLSAQKINLELKWSANQKCFQESSATVADVDNNGWDEAIIASQEELIAVGKTGAALWRWKTRSRYTTYPAILQRQRELALIYAADNSGQLTCLNGKGVLVWQAELSAGSEWSAGVIADLDANGSTEYIQTDSKGTVWVFDALSGRVIKKVQLSGQPVSPAVGDLNGDGKPELAIATTDGWMIVLTGNLSELWKYKIGGSSESWSTSAPVIFGASDGQAYMVAVSGNGLVYCFNTQGKPVWKYPLNVPVASSVSVGDFDQDGRADLFLVTQKGIIYRLSESGNLIWKIDMQGRCLAPGAIADINNDGKLEYVLASQQGHLLVFSNNGDVIFDHQLPSRTINVTPSVGNITGDPNKADLFLTGGESGLNYCFETPSAKKMLVHWASYRGNIQNTGCWVGLIQTDELHIAPKNLEWNKLYSGEPVQFNINNPNPGTSPLKATAICMSPDGSKSSTFSNIFGKEGQLLLPVDIIIPGTYRFFWTLTTAEGKELLSSSREVTMEPFANDRALIKQSGNTLRVAAHSVENVLPLSANALLKRASDLQANANSISEMQEMAAVSDATAIAAVISKTAKLNEEAKRAGLISEVVIQAATLGSGTSLIAFQGKKWDNRIIDKQLPTLISNPVKINQKVVPGEHNPVPLVLFNVTDQLLNVRVAISNGNNEIKITSLHSVATPTSMGEESWDALPATDESGVISIPSLTSRELWLDIAIGEVDPGKHELTITFQALNGAGVMDAPGQPLIVKAPETRVEISLDVLPFKIAAPGAFRLCTWSPSTGPEVEGLLAHGNNVFLIPSPKVIYNNQELTGVDYTECDKITSQFKNKDIFFLISGLPAINQEFASEGYRKQFGFYLNNLVGHLKESGIGTDRFALYPVDEPGGGGWNAVNKVVKFGEMAQAVNPDVMLYQDGGGELPMFDAMAKYLDVWVPPFDWLADKSPEMNIMRTTGKWLWSYNCSYSSARPIGPNIKNINLLYEYRTAALLAMRNGASGIGYWCYNSVSDNPWSRIKLEYNLIYPGESKSVTSRRWEAVREGIEDYRILAALKDYLKPDSKIDEQTRKDLEHLFNVSLPNLVDPGYQAMKLGQSRETFDRACNELKMEDFRNEMLSVIESVQVSKNQKQKYVSWAEKLGFPAGKKVLLLHMDDAGMCPEANAAVEKYITKGHLLSASVMMPCPNAAEFIEWAKGHPEADIGVHLTLTSEWNNYRWGPVTEASKVLGLIDPAGKLWPEVPDVVMHASPSEIEMEIRAQIDKVLSLGFKPTHIDTHMGTLYGSVDYINVALKVAQEYHLPAFVIDLSVPMIAEQFKKAGYPINDEVISHIGDYRLPMLDNYTYVHEGDTYEEKRAIFFELVKSLYPGLTEIIFHPSTLTDNLKSITNSWQQRVWEGEMFSDPVVLQFFKDEGIVITNWTEIMKRFEKKK